MSAAHKLTNADIVENYRHVTIHMMRKGFTAQFARWVVEQSPYEVPVITASLAEFNDYISEVMAGEEVKSFSYDELSDIICAAQLEKIPAVLELNVAKVTTGDGYVDRHTVPHPDYDFIDLGALARNIFFSIVRNHINWDT